MPSAEYVPYPDPFAHTAAEFGEAPPVDAPAEGGPETEYAISEATEGEFLSAPSETEEPVAGTDMPREMGAAPADLKETAPRRLGPPAGWESGPEVPPMEVEPVTSDTFWEEPVEFAQEVPQAEIYYEGEYAEQPEQPYEPQYEEQVHEEQVEEQGVPVGIPMRPRVPTPLTSPHSDRPATRRVTQQIRPSTGQTTRFQTSLPAPHGHTTQSIPAIPAKHGPHPVADQRLIPSWVLIAIGFLVGTIGALVAVVKSPLREKIGLMERARANAYVLAVLKEERSQVQAMLDEYYRNAKIALSEEMAEFRTEMGRKAPERMTLQEFTAEIKEQEAIKKTEEEEDKKAAEEEAKAEEDEKKEAADAEQ